MEAHVRGTIVLRALIGTNGDAERASVISGPAMFKPAVLKAVRLWHWEPWLVKGRPVEVNTLITVHCSNF